MSEPKTENVPQKNAPKYVGLFFVLFSVYIAVACISYMFTWKTDQDKLTLGFLDYFFDSKIESANLLGKIGAAIAHFLFYNGTGVVSLLLCYIFFVVGLKLLINIWIVKPFKLFKHSFFWIVWTSILLGLVFRENLVWLGGSFGYHLSYSIQNLLGTFGLIALLLTSLLVYLTITYQWNFSSLETLFKSEKIIPKPEPEVTPEIPETIQAQTDTNLSYKPKSRLHDLVPVTVEEVIGEEDFQVYTKDEPVKPSVFPPIKEEFAPDLSFEVEAPREKPVEIIQEDEDVPFTTSDPYDSTLDLSSYKMPPLDLLNDFGDSEININREELESNKNKIVQTLNNYSIEISKIKATVGPTVTLYEIIPAPGVRISKIKNLEDDIALSLSALGIRIIAPIPGKGTIGIEVPNQTPEIVGMRSILNSDKFQNAKMDLPLALGKTISNETFVTDLAKMPHLLMAGATGQGKSVGLNAILVSLLYKKHPSQIKFVLVDPKKVELTLFNKIERHYLAKLPNSEEAIITDTKKVVNTLNSLCIEMDNRYELLKVAQVRNLREYNAKFVERKLNPNEGHQFLPFIVLVIDEFADLIMTAGKEVETPIARLAQLARAIGIHLIIATQRPSVNIITGTIKANFPSRIAFRVTSKVDSRTILDSGGADQLIGKGDMLLSTGSELIRIQCAFVDTPEVEKICDFIGGQRGYSNAFLLPEYIDEESENSKEEFSMEDRDALFEEAAHIVVTHQQGSASLLQRKLKLGYNRAGRLIDQLEAAGIVGPFEGSKARQVLFPDENSLVQFLTNLTNSNKQ